MLTMNPVGDRSTTRGFVGFSRLVGEVVDADAGDFVRRRFVHWQTLR